MSKVFGLWVPVCLFLVLLVACRQPEVDGATNSAAPTATPTTPAAGVTPAPTATETSETAVSHGGPVRDHVSMIDHLRARGYTVEPIGDVEQPFLRARGTTLRISGGDLQQPAEVQSYDYNDTEAAAADAAQIGPDGNPRTAMITWVAPPHFFLKERAFVLYVGSDPAVLRLLDDTLGPQFAGR